MENPQSTQYTVGKREFAMMSQFSGAAIIDWKLKQQKSIVSVLETWGWFLLRDGREGSVAGHSVWLVDGCLPPTSPHFTFPLRVSVCEQISPFYKDTDHN